LYYGETEDYTFDYVSPTVTTSDFSRPDSAYVGTPVRFNNSNQTGYISHKWTIDTFDYFSTNVLHVFKNDGVYNAKLVSTNCIGVDSTTKTIKIITPKAPPVSDFVADKKVYEIFETIQLTDLSSNGATYWNWMFVNSKTNDTIDGDMIGQLRGNDPFLTKNPQLVYGMYI
jgi:PKD repeat protein